MKRYWPLLVIILMSIIAGSCLLAISPDNSLKYLMVNFAGVFFLFLSTLKFWDLKGFYRSFCEYDLIAARYPLYGYLYPFLELVISAGFLTHFFLRGVALITAIVMIVLALGILIALFKGKKLLCACMGSKLDIPLGAVSIVESLGMGTMSILIFLDRF